MTDYELLYSKFKLKEDDSRRLNELHRFSKTCQSAVEKIIVTTAITDATGTEILKSEVQNAELV
jgi:hypothetical protein